MDIQVSQNPCTGLPVPPVLTTTPKADYIQPDAECPSPAQQTLKRSLNQLITEAAKIHNSFKKDRVALGKVLMEIHTVTARRGNGNFQNTCRTIGFTVGTAYAYMHEAGWVGLPAKKKRVARKAVPPSSHVARRGDFVELSFEADERQAQLASQVMKDNPHCLARLIHELIRVSSIVKNEAAVIAALQTATTHMSLLNTA